jgi:hypothetical protein
METIVLVGVGSLAAVRQSDDAYRNALFIIVIVIATLVAVGTMIKAIYYLVLHPHSDLVLEAFTKRAACQIKCRYKVARCKH